MWSADSSVDMVGAWGGGMGKLGVGLGADETFSSVFPVSLGAAMSSLGVVEPSGAIP